MKKFTFAICLALLLASCNDHTGGGTESGDAVSQPAPPVQENVNSAEAIATEKLLGAPLYKNPPRGAAHMMRASDGFYYAYDGDASNWTVNRSKNGTSWQNLGKDKAYPNGTWGKANFWVPEVIEYQGKYYMYYCARIDAATPSSRIGLAISDSPLGPFKDTGHPLFDGTEMADWHVIDPNPYIDPDTGKKYMYFVKDGSLYSYYNKDLKKDVQESHIFGIELSDDMLSVVGHPVELIVPSQDWEYKSYTINHKNRLWNEAPEMLKHDGMYYLMYSANMFSNQYYAIGYAKSNNPLGPFVKYDNNPVIGSVGTIQKAGHNSIIKSPDGSEYFTSYTTLKNGRFISRIGFRNDGTLYVNGPIASYQVMPNGTTDYVNAAKTAKITASSTKPGYRAEAINDGEIGIYDRYEAYEWASNGEKAGAEVQLTWDQPHSIEYILLYDSAVKNRMIKSGTVILNGNAQEAIHGISFPANSDPAVLHFAEGKQVTDIQFVVDELADAGGTAGLSEIVVLEKK